MTILLLRFIFVFLSLLLTISYNVLAQTDHSELDKIILRQDSLIFDEAFNKCKLQYLETAIAEDLEFFHDQSGITYGKVAFINSIKNNICSLSYRPRRELVKKSHSIFPLFDNGKLYGVIQTGKHKFFANEEGRPEYFTSIAEFSHLWIKSDKKWLLKRVLSYDHKDQEVEDPVHPNFEKLDLNNLLIKYNVPSVGIATVNNGKLTRTMVYGELQKGVPAPFNAIYNVASLTKPIVSMTVLQLVHQGLWDLDEPLYHYWIDPEVQEDQRHKLLTTRHILNHETGFLNWRWLHESKKLTFDFTPGTGFNYSGEGFEYLRKALEHKFEKTLEEISKEQIFDPLRMTDTQFRWTQETDESRFALWHNKNGDKISLKHKINEVNAADNLLTTLGDYGNFAAWVIDGLGISETLYSEMVDTHKIDSIETKMGLGWEVHDGLADGNYALIHSGSDKGVQALVILVPKSKEGLIIFTNGDNGNQLYEEIVINYLSVGRQLWEMDK